MFRFITSIFFGFFLTSFSEFAVAEEKENKALHKAHVSIVKDHRSVRHIGVKPAAELIAEEDTLFFDVREEKEFNISHIVNSQHVDPELSASDFMSQFDQDWSGKTLVFYCSVGRRSSILAEKVQAELKAAGAKEVYNLKEGIFAWHNAEFPLENAAGPTELVHPYNAFWGRMVNRKDLMAYKHQD